VAAGAEAATVAGLLLAAEAAVPGLALTLAPVGLSGGCQTGLAAAGFPADGAAAPEGAEPAGGSSELVTDGVEVAAWAESWAAGAAAGLPATLPAGLAEARPSAA